jgi:putative inorganic carbon (hco3(-)) transporter
MKSAWTKIMFSEPSNYGWLKISYLYRSLGWLSAWRQGSWFLEYLEPVGACLLALIFSLAPFSSTSLVGVLLIAAAAYWLLILFSETPKLDITPIHILVFIYWCIASIATAFSPVKSAAFSGWVTLTLYLILFALSARVLRSPRLRNWTIFGFLAIALVVSVYGVRQQFFGVEQLATWNDPNSPLAKDTRVYSYLGNPNLLGGYLLPAIALSIAAIFVWQGWLPKTLAVMMFAINSACLYFTDSRGAWLSMAGMISVMLLLLYWWWREYLPRFWRIWLLPLVFGSLGCLFVLAFILVEPLRLRFASIFAGREDSSNNFRIEVWKAVDKMIADYPFTGIGPGHDAFNLVYPRYMNSRYPALSAYSIYLEHLVEMGYLGLGCFIWLLAVTFNHGIIQIDRLRRIRNTQGLWLIGSVAALVGLSIQGFVDTVWYRPAISTLWWFVLGIVASNYNTFRSNEVSFDRSEELSNK